MPPFSPAKTSLYSKSGIQMANQYPEMPPPIPPRQALDTSGGHVTQQWSYAGGRNKANQQHFQQHLQHQHPQNQSSLKMVPTIQQQSSATPHHNRHHSYESTYFMPQFHTNQTGPSEPPKVPTRRPSLSAKMVPTLINREIPSVARESDQIYSNQFMGIPRKVPQRSQSLNRHTSHTVGMQQQTTQNPHTEITPSGNPVMLGSLNNDLFGPPHSVWKNAATTLSPKIPSISVRNSSKNRQQYSKNQTAEVNLNGYLDTMLADPGPQCMLWLPLMHRMTNVENVTHPVPCSFCHQLTMHGFRYRCQKCANYQLCQTCFWNGSASAGHSIDHEMKEYSTYKTPAKQLTHNIKKGTLRCFPATLNGTHPSKLGQTFPEGDPNAIINLQHVIPANPISSEINNHLQRDTLLTSQHNRWPEEVKMNDEHRLIARYAASLAQEALNSLGGKSTASGSLFSTDANRQQREILAELEQKNRDITQEIAQLKAEQDETNRMSGVANSNASYNRNNPSLLVELRSLRQRKEELEGRMNALQDSRRELMVQLESLMKHLRINTSQSQLSSSYPQPNINQSQLSSSYPQPNVNQSQLSSSYPQPNISQSQLSSSYPQPNINQSQLTALYPQPNSSQSQNFTLYPYAQNSGYSLDNSQSMTHQQPITSIFNHNITPWTGGGLAEHAYNLPQNSLANFQQYSLQQQQLLAYHQAPSLPSKHPSSLLVPAGNHPSHQGDNVHKELAAAANNVTSAVSNLVQDLTIGDAPSSAQNQHSTLGHSKEVGCGPSHNLQYQEPAALMHPMFNSASYHNPIYDLNNSLSSAGFYPQHSVVQQQLPQQHQQQMLLDQLALYQQQQHFGVPVAGLNQLTADTGPAHHN